MIRKNLLIFLALVVVLGVGCRTTLIRNVEQAPVTLHETQKPTMEEIEKAIITAGAGLGWRIKIQNPGNMVGTLTVRRHVAVVSIDYNAENYSITYKDSTNLKYDGESIHSNYNGWVQNLEKAINVQLASL